MISADAPSDIWIAQAPDMSVVSLTLNALLGDSAGIPPPVRLRLLSAISSRAGREALAPMLISTREGRRTMPSAIAPLIPVDDLPLRDQTDALRSNQSGTRLRDDLVDIYGDAVPRQWLPAAERPDRWSRALADLTDDVWNQVGASAWARARPLIHREYRRVGAALARRRGDALLNSLSSRITYQQNRLVIDRRVPVPLAGRPVVLVPMIASPGSVTIEMDDPSAVVVGYAMDGATRLWDSAAPQVRPAEDALATMIGIGRAAVLRSLARHQTVGELAVTLGRAPSTVTHHCDALESTGLIERVRHGKTVWLRRTQRGGELVDLFS